MADLGIEGIADAEPIGSGGNATVYRALEVKAASDLTHVPVDTAVDRSQVIRVGYVLAAVLACAAPLC